MSFDFNFFFQNTFLTSGGNAFLANGKLIFNNGPRGLPRNPPG